MEIKFFKSSLEFEFEESKERYEEFLQEYLSSNNYINLSKWKKLASRVDFSEGERIIFDLLMDIKQELYLIKNDINKTKLFTDLKYKAFVVGVNFAHIQFKDKCLRQDEDYYARFEINGQKISIFFKALNEYEAKISQIKAEDELAYDNFVTNMQRAMIKILKEQENG